ncbi:MAG: hypothetical protein RL662_1068 [Bacteroidota bacterium]|jgi:hypothetical protein
MRKKCLSFVLSCLSLASGSLNAQQIGVNTVTPDPSSILDITSTDKGFLPPRVNLTSTTLDLDGIPGQATGLLVYNIGSNLPQGYYFWNGSEWRSIEESSAVLPEIDQLVCIEATLEPSELKRGVAFRGLLKVPYTGGNAGKYSIGKPIASTGNTGLTATLKAGKLEHGVGFLVYDVTGTPAQDSPTGARFALSFGTNAPKTCTAVVGTVVTADIKHIATIGPLQFTTDDGVSGYHRVITSPDGKFSVRVFVPSGVQLGNSDLQIRSNTEPVSLMWNGHVSYRGGNIGSASNALVLPDYGFWYGNDGTNSDVAVWVGTNANAAWGDPDVYYQAPEQRSYMWTTTNVNDKTTYVLTFMMGAVKHTDLANSTNIRNTKAFLKIEQINAAS